MFRHFRNLFAAANCQRRALEHAPRQRIFQPISGFSAVPLATISTAVGRLSRRLQFRALCCQLTSKADKLPTDTEPVARDNNTIFTLKLGDQTFVSPYSTDNRSKFY